MKKIKRIIILSIIILLVSCTNEEVIYPYDIIICTHEENVYNKGFVVERFLNNNIMYAEQTIYNAIDSCGIIIKDKNNTKVKSYLMFFDYDKKEVSIDGYDNNIFIGKQLYRYDDNNKITVVIGYTTNGLMHCLQHYKRNFDSSKLISVEYIKFGDYDNDNEVYFSALNYENNNVECLIEYTYDGENNCINYIIERNYYNNKYENVKYFINEIRIFYEEDISKQIKKQNKI